MTDLKTIPQSPELLLTHPLVYRLIVLENTLPVRSGLGAALRCGGGEFLDGADATCYRGHLGVAFLIWAAVVGGDD